VTRAWIGLLATIALLVVSCAFVGYAYLDLAGTALPYQDAPALLQQQAAEVAALEERLRLYLSISAGLGLLSLGALAYALVRWRGRPRRAVGS
jgi:hypothetical protein